MPFFCRSEVCVGPKIALWCPCEKSSHTSMTVLLRLWWLMTFREYDHRWSNFPLDNVLTRTKIHLFIEQMLPIYLPTNLPTYLPTYLNDFYLNGSTAEAELESFFLLKCVSIFLSNFPSFPGSVIRNSKATGSFLSTSLSTVRRGDSGHEGWIGTESLSQER